MRADERADALSGNRFRCTTIVHTAVCSTVLWYVWNTMKQPVIIIKHAIYPWNFTNVNEADSMCLKWKV